VTTSSDNLIQKHHTCKPVGRYEEIAAAIGRLVDSKNKAYGDSFGDSADLLLMLYPDGIKPDQYGDVQSILRIWDKLKRIATSKNAFGENPWQDIAGYAILMNKDTDI